MKDRETVTEFIVDVVKGTIAQFGKNEEEISNMLIGNQEIDFTEVEDLEIKIVS